MNGLPATALLLAAACVAGFLTLAFAAQRSVLYPRPPAPKESPAAGRPDVEIVRLGRPGERVEAWYLAPRNGAAEAPALLFTHGNGELIDHWLDAFQEPPAWGVAVLLLEYPGYGRSEGTPSQASITRAAAAGFDFLAQRPEVHAARIVAYGRSLGGGAACALSREREVAALVLESTFTSVRALARRFAVPGGLVRDPFENLAAVKAFEGPVLLVHGRRDAVVPVEHGRRLAEAAADAELHVLDCGHNDCPRPWTQLRGFLVRHGLLAGPPA